MQSNCKRGWHLDLGLRSRPGAGRTRETKKWGWALSEAVGLGCGMTHLRGWSNARAPRSRPAAQRVCANIGLLVACGRRAAGRQSLPLLRRVFKLFLVLLAEGVVLLADGLEFKFGVIALAQVQVGEGQA